MNQSKEEKPVSEKEMAEAFIAEYQELCEKYQFQIVVQPTLVARDDGTWSIKQISSVGKLPRKE